MSSLILLLDLARSVPSVLRLSVFTLASSVDIGDNGGGFLGWRHSEQLLCCFFHWRLGAVLSSGSVRSAALASPSSCCSCWFSHHGGTKTVSSFFLLVLDCDIRCIMMQSCPFRCSLTTCISVDHSVSLIAATCHPGDAPPWVRTHVLIAPTSQLSEDSALSFTTVKFLHCSLYCGCTRPTLSFKAIHQFLPSISVLVRCLF